MLSKRLFTDFFPTYLKKKGKIFGKRSREDMQETLKSRAKKGMTSLISNMLKLEFVLYLALVSEPSN